jgi:nucleoside phosphorylase
LVGKPEQVAIHAVDNRSQKEQLARVLIVDGDAIVDGNRRAAAQRPQRARARYIAVRMRGSRTARVDARSFLVGA